MLKDLTESGSEKKNAIFGKIQTDEQSTEKKTPIQSINVRSTLGTVKSRMNRKIKPKLFRKSMQKKAKKCIRKIQNKTYMQSKANKHPIQKGRSMVKTKKWPKENSGKNNPGLTEKRTGRYRRKNRGRRRTTGK